MTKVNLDALNEYVVERLKHAWEFDLVDIFDPVAVERQVESIVRLLSQDFWMVEWSIRVQDNANVRGMIKEDLATLAQNYKLGRHWSEDLKLPQEDQQTEPVV
jgi:predicted component of type VI protein secretion system